MHNRYVSVMLYYWWFFPILGRRVLVLGWNLEWRSRPPNVVSIWQPRLNGGFAFPIP